MRLIRFGLVSQASIPLAAFYDRAFGFRPGSAAQLAPTELSDELASRTTCSAVDFGLEARRSSF